MCSNPGSSNFRSSLFTFNSRFIAKRTSNKLCASPQVCLLLTSVLPPAHHFQFHLTRCRILTILARLPACNMSLHRQWKVTVTKFIRFVFNALFPCTLGYQENKPTGYTTLLSFQQRNYWKNSRPFFYGAISPSGPGSPHCRGFMSPLRHATLGRPPLDEGSARRRDIYLTTHNTHKRQTFVPPRGIRTRKPSKRTALDPLLSPRGHWVCHVTMLNVNMA